MSQKVKQEVLEDASTPITDQWLFESVKMEEEEEMPNVFSNKKEVFHESDEDEDLSETEEMTRPDEELSRSFKLDKENDKSTSSWDKALEDAPVSKKVRSLCKFQCPKCKKIFSSRSGLTKHLRCTKHAWSSSIMECLIETVAHKCKICNKLLLCDTGQIGNHIRCHEIKSLKQYINLTDDKSSFELDEENDKSTPSWDKALEKAPVSKRVGNLCEFQCPNCEKIIMSRGGFLKHIKHTRHAHASSLMNYLIKAVAHKCKICHKLMFCDIYQISSHVRYHEIYSLKQYTDLTENETESLQQKWKHHRQRIWENVETATSQTLGNLCQFQCHKCKKEFPSYKILLDHVKVSGHQCKDMATKCVIKAVTHQCQICAKKILCDRIMLSNHFRSKHKLKSIKEYTEITSASETSEFKDRPRSAVDQLSKKNFTKYETSRQAKNLCQYSCIECNFSCRSWKLMMKHNSRKRHAPLLKITKYLTHVAFHQCHVCDKVIFCDTHFIGSHVKTHNLSLATYCKKMDQETPSSDVHSKYLKKLQECIKDIPIVQAKEGCVLKANSLPEDKLTKNLGNLSFFKCPCCPKTNMPFSMFSRHCKTKHNMKKHSAYNAAHVVEARYHKCCICSEIVLCDNIFVKRHVMTSHKLSVSKYVSDYVVKNGGIVLPSFTDFRKDNKVFEPLFADKDKKDNEAEDQSDEGLILPSMLSSESEDSDEGETA